MSTSESLETFLTGLSHRLLSRYGGAQIFLFGPKGEPFWAARTPVRPEELHRLADALELIESTEALRPRPFLARDALRGFTVAALDERHDLYVVLFDEDPSRPFAEARVVAVLEEMSPLAEPIRRMWLSPHASSGRAS